MTQDSKGSGRGSLAWVLVVCPVEKRHSSFTPLIVPKHAVFWRFQEVYLQVKYLLHYNASLTRSLCGHTTRDHHPPYPPVVTNSTVVAYHIALRKLCECKAGTFRTRKFFVEWLGYLYGSKVNIMRISTPNKYNYERDAIIIFKFQHIPTAYRSMT